MMEKIFLATTQIKPKQGQEHNPISQKGEMNTIKNVGISLQPNTPYNYVARLSNTVIKCLDREKIYKSL